MGVGFRVLGPVQVVCDQQRPPALGAKPRLLLAMLLTRRGQVVSVDALIDGLWGDAPPATASGVIQTYVSQLRKLLATTGDGAPRLERVEPGYRLLIGPDDIDSVRFERLLASASASLHDGRPADALQFLDESTQLWRGPAFADMADQPTIRPEAQRLDALRVLGIEERIDAEILVGRDRELIAELEVLVAAFPLRERMWKQLMLCLYRDGRRADALRAFQRARAAVGEVGLDPGAELRELESAILDHEPAPSLRRLSWC